MLRHVESQIEIEVSKSEIFAALLEEFHLKNWWGVDKAFIEKKDGGLYTLTWSKPEFGFQFISTGKIRFYNPREHLVLEDLLYISHDKEILGPFTLKYEVIENDNSCTLKVKQANIQKGGLWDWYYESIKEGWPKALFMLKNYLEIGE